ncbi:hypothetical protein NKH77_09185 [Streptomyces sp. M19]
MCEYAGYGAEALFFDDSIFWSGRFGDITAFCTELREIRQAPADELDERYRRFLPEDADLERLRHLQWGAQLTVDVLAALHTPRRRPGSWA